MEATVSITTTTIKMDDEGQVLEMNEKNKMTKSSFTLDPIGMFKSGIASQQTTIVKNNVVF